MLYEHFHFFMFVAFLVVTNLITLILTVIFCKGQNAYLILLPPWQKEVMFLVELVCLSDCLLGTTLLKTL